MAILMCATMGLGVFARAPICIECGSGNTSAISEETDWEFAGYEDCEATSEMDAVYECCIRKGYACHSCGFEDVKETYRTKIVCNHY